jgi:hypothetical protein
MMAAIAAATLAAANAEPDTILEQKDEVGDAKKRYSKHKLNKNDATYKETFLGNFLASIF